MDDFRTTKNDQQQEVWLCCMDDAQPTLFHGFGPIFIFLFFCFFFFSSPLFLLFLEEDDSRYRVIQFRPAPNVYYLARPSVQLPSGDARARRVAPAS